MSLSLNGVPDGQAKQRAEHAALPIRILTDDGARVALQRGPILRVGAANFNTIQFREPKLSSFLILIWSGFLDEATNDFSRGYLHEAMRLGEFPHQTS